MPSSIINSDDGTVSGTAGLKSSAGNDGVLKIQNNGSDSVTVAADGDVTLAADLAVTGNVTVTGTISGSGLSGSAVRVYNSPATWTKPTGLQYIKVTVIGGGGGGQGISKRNVNSPAARLGDATASFGGGGGGAAISYIAAPSLPGPVSVTVGSGGTGAPAPAVPTNPAINFTTTYGNSGGTSSFGPFLSATGGPGTPTPGTPVPVQCAPNIPFNYIQGGVGSGGMFNYKGGITQNDPTGYFGYTDILGNISTITNPAPVIFTLYSSSVGLPANPQSYFLYTLAGGTNGLASAAQGGLGSYSVSVPIDVRNLNAQNATTIGEGGSGASVQTPNTTRAGGNGAAGIVIVEEFYS